MQADPLQHLRDIHLPADPSWWPPAPGWWLLFAALITLAYYTRRYWAHRAARTAPLQHARRLYAAQYAQFSDKTQDAAGYVNNTNDILKRALIHIRGDARAPAASGDAWLQLLDELSQSTAFTQGPGQALGNARFAPSMQLDADGFHHCVSQLLRQLNR